MLIFYLSEVKKKILFVKASLEVFNGQKNQPNICSYNILYNLMKFWLWKIKLKIVVKTEENGTKIDENYVRFQ